MYAALFAALTCVMTMIVKIPVPATGGYVNLGDCVVLLAGWVLGPMYGGAAAGLGSMLADLVSGYPLYAPGTFVIKACMAVCAWAVFRAAAGEKRGLAARIGGAGGGGGDGGGRTSPMKEWSLDSAWERRPPSRANLIQGVSTWRSR